MIHSRLCERFDLTHPVLSAPLALASGGALACAVTKAGGLGFIGGGYGDSDWTMQAFDDAGLIRDRAPAGEIIENMVTEVEALLRGASARLEG